MAIKGSRRGYSSSPAGTSSERFDGRRYHTSDRHLCLCNGIAGSCLQDQTFYTCGQSLTLLLLRRVLDWLACLGQ